MATQLQHPSALPPMPAVARILARYDRRKLEAFIGIAIDLLDTLDGDPDEEAAGDEQDGQFNEEEGAARFSRCGNGPGCIIADPDKGGEDEGEVDDGI